jgi:hypothetical protein
MPPSHLLPHSLLLTVGVAALSGLAAPQRAAAQEQAPPCPAPILVTSHSQWLPGAIRRLDLASGHELASAGTGSLPLATAVRALETAAEAGGSPAVRRAASLYLARLAAEYPALTGSSDCGPWIDARAEAGYLEERGLLRPGFGYFAIYDWTGAFPVEPVSSPAAGGTATAGWGRLGGRLEVMGLDGELRIRDVHVAADLGDVVVWAGRRALHYGPARGGGLVIGGDALTTGVGAVVTDPITLPWVLGHLGPMGMESFFGKARGGERIVDPWFWGARLTATPHPRFRIGASRGTMYGGEGNTEVTWYHSLQMLVGMHSGVEGEFDNHFGSVDLRWALPWLPTALPLELYLEWAMHDSAGAWWDMPARLLGVGLPTLPFLPAVGLSAEVADWPRRCCGNPMWYRNWGFRMGWTNDGQTVAHPMGGHGRELSIRADAVALDGDVVGWARGFRRARGQENLFYPQWFGHSMGGELVLLYQPGPGPGGTVRAFVERGDGWTAARVFGGVTWSF